MACHRKSTISLLTLLKLADDIYARDLLRYLNDFHEEVNWNGCISSSVALGCVPDRFERRGEEKNTFVSLKCNPG